MKCPYCQNEMKEGYLNTGRSRILFSKEDRYDTVPANSDIILRKHFHGMNPSYYCEQCKIIITPVESKERFRDQVDAFFSKKK